MATFLVTMAIIWAVMTIARQEFEFEDVFMAAFLALFISGFFLSPRVS